MWLEIFKAYQQKTENQEETATDPGRATSAASRNSRPHRSPTCVNLHEDAVYI